MRTFDDGAPAGYYVEGTLDSGAFAPEGDVLGQETPAEAGTPGWLELMDGSFYAAQSGRTPRRPYVEGSMGQDGLFRPSIHIVNY